MAGSTTAESAAREQLWCDLMRDAQDGDRVAYAQLLAEIVPLLKRFVARRWYDFNEVDDIVQEVLLSVHGVRHTYDPSRPFMPWLMTIARRRIADAARRKTSRRRYETTVDVMPETFPGQETNTVENSIEAADEIRHAMSVLPDTQREAIELLKVKGLSLAEASSVTGKSIAALKVSVHRGLKKMRRSLQE